jgi:alpha-glucosidase
MVKGTWKGIHDANPGVRPFVLSRAVFLGGQQYAAGWSGDNSADWYHLEASIPMVLNMGMSAFPLYGPDIGGFAGNGDAKLFSRWFGLGTMLPFSRGHTGKGNIDKEPWAFGPEVEATCREALERRYRLIPYLYTLSQEASTSGLPIARPAFFADPTDPALRSEDDSFLLGDNLLVVAAVLPDSSRVAVMPKGLWAEAMHSENADLPRVFVKGGGIVPMGPVVQYVGEKPLGELTLVVCLDEAGKASGTFYDDAGDGYGYQKGDFRLSTFEAEVKGEVLTIKEANAKGSRAKSWATIKVEVVTPAGRKAGFTSVKVEE